MANRDFNLERLYMALFGYDEEKAKKEAENYYVQRREETWGAVNAANAILEKNHVSSEDIPNRDMVKVAADALVLSLEAFESVKKLTSEMKTRSDIAEADMLKKASNLLHANEGYVAVCKVLNETGTLSSEQESRLATALHESTKTYYGTGHGYSYFDVQVYAYSVLRLAAREFIKIENPSVSDATKVVAAHHVMSFVVQACKPYNVTAAEDRIHDLERYVLYKRAEGIPDPILTATMPLEARSNRELFERAAEEIDNILNHTEERFGYRLNYIRSGMKNYHVFRWHGTVVDPNAEYPVGTLEAEELGTYDTYEEALQASKGETDAPAEIVEFDPEEMWSIVGPNGENPTQMIYPSKVRAAVFLIGYLGEEVLPNWHAWERYLDEKESVAT